MNTARRGTEPGHAAPSPASDAWLALRLFALAPAALGGVCLRAGAGPVRDRWIADLRASLAPHTPWRPCPVHIDTDRLLGGLDLAATLRTGRSVAQRGLLAEADGGVVVLAMAERASESTVAHLAAALDSGELIVARNGIDERHAARFGVLALDEGADADEGPKESLLDRAAFHVELDGLSLRELDAVPDATPMTALSTGDALRHAELADDILEALCAAALALGVSSIRACVFAARVARLHAAMKGHMAVTSDDAAVAARLVLAPRATRVPAPPRDAASQDDDAAHDDAAHDEPQPRDNDLDSADPRDVEARDDARADDARADTARHEPEPDNERSDDDPPSLAATPEDVVLAAALAAIPAGLLARLAAGLGVRGQRAAAGRVGAAQQGRRGGRPAGLRRAPPRNGARLDLIATLRAAAPWQRLRAQRANSATDLKARGSRVHVRAEDFHVMRRIQRGRTVTIFAVDASGSSALQRLAEAKGAVELLLAECYVRRDSVAVIAFRGRGSELLLPPTRSLVRAKRSLAELPGGGGTPLAAGIDAALELALAVRRKGDTPVIVVLTDGRANVARDGRGGRVQADVDALLSARALCAAQMSALLVDTSPQPQAKARDLARAMQAHYLPLPYAGAATLSEAVRSVAHAEPMRSR